MLDAATARLTPVFEGKILTHELPKPAISVIGLGYVGAVSCGCLSMLGHRVVGADIDEHKVTLIGEGRSPIFEDQLDDLLSAGVQDKLLSTTTKVFEAVANTDVTFVSVGTPTSADGGCDTRYIEAAAEEIGKAIATKTSFHTVVMRCSIPPGSTMGIMVPIIEEFSGKKAGRDFGVAFNPEFLREGVAVDDFNHPPKTVLGVSDDRTADVVAGIFAPVDPDPIITSIETAELAKYVDNVWHAAKVCFGNEVGRLAKAVGVDGHEVMRIFVQDTKLNLSPYYLKPGFAYGGSCLPKEVRAVQHMAEKMDIEVPMISGLQDSNKAQIDQAYEMIRKTGAKRVGILGLAFKPGTDDLRESPILEVMARLRADGVELLAHDEGINEQTQIEAQLSYVRHASQGLQTLAGEIQDMLREDVQDVLAHCDAVIVTHPSKLYLRTLKLRQDLPVVDVVRLFKESNPRANYDGIGW